MNSDENLPTVVQGGSNYKPVRSTKAIPSGLSQQKVPQIFNDVRNVPQHTLIEEQEWFEENVEFKVFAWPPNSPDLNLIQKVWCTAMHRNLQDLKDLLLMSWCQIPQDTFRDVVESMPRRVSGVWQNKEDK